MVTFTTKIGNRLGQVLIPFFEDSPKRLSPLAVLTEGRRGGSKGGTALAQLVDRTRSQGVFTGKKGEILPVVSPVSGRVDAAVLAGLGERESASLESIRRTGGVLARRLAAERPPRTVLALGSDSLLAQAREWGIEATACAFTEGWIRGVYVYDHYKTANRKKIKPARLQILGAGLTASEAKAARRGVHRGKVLAEAVNYTRDLCNAPANELYPAVLASRARALARQKRLSVDVLGVRELKRLRMGALLGVGQGSVRPPRLIVVRYRPRGKAKKRIALVGKAVTFDSGGLSLKPSKGMEEMKFDMSGGAAVLGALHAAASLKPPVEIIGLVPAAENMVGGGAVRPGDVIRSAAGKTIEVINTDAEGRLILADALHYARRFKPDYIVDLATLTGACLIALGTVVSGLMGNDKKLSQLLFEAGERTGERVWELPLYDEFIDVTRSGVADIKNHSGRNAGTITAAAFLHHFVGETPWCHLDIAGTAWAERESPHSAGGSTGVGVRLLAEFLDLVR